MWTAKLDIFLKPFFAINFYNPHLFQKNCFWTTSIVIYKSSSDRLSWKFLSNQYKHHTFPGFHDDSQYIIVKARREILSCYSIRLQLNRYPSTIFSQSLKHTLYRMKKKIKMYRRKYKNLKVISCSRQIYKNVSFQWQFCVFSLPSYEALKHISANGRDLMVRMIAMRCFNSGPRQSDFNMQ